MTISTTPVVQEIRAAVQEIPAIRVSFPQHRITPQRQQRWRLWSRSFFLALFILAPVFNLLRYDLSAGHAVILGMDWRLGIDDFSAGQISASQLGMNILLRLFVPLVGGAVLFLAVARRWGRIYCGWLCPHFSVVETINYWMRRASGRPSLWEKKPLPAKNPDGSPFHSDPRWWWITLPLAIVFALVWAVVLLTYLLPPAEIYSHLWHGTLTRNQTLFITVATVLLSLEFLFARHLFCRFGCAIGLFQSLAWMTNRDGLVVGFARNRAADCSACYRSSGMGIAACEAVCPMRLKPRSPKNGMFTCTQCVQCVAACTTVQGEGNSLLTWVTQESARQQEARVGLLG